MKAEWQEFASGQKLADALADTVAERLEGAIAARGTAVIAVSGGSTPPPFFKALSRRKLNWARVTVTLADERFVPSQSGRSNARLVTQNLLQNDAARAGFIGLYHNREDVEAAAEMADRAVGALPLPLDVAVLGMGTDGHTASFFPDAENLDELLDPAGDRHVLPVHAPSAVEPRLTLSMPLICNARLVALHIEGADKRKVLEAALAQDEGPMPPIRTVLENAVSPAHIYWAPKKDAKP
ncbi:6-phosphogluconolactonase [Chelativorans salis]|uniref:6-phosphogluconolactonase n=1 Tax=Chelativorans salis TaxID=2978478 RepID=A0ABT2LK36_9HYPH|nr:6-phosphogluconolactonase [Chelativorans sp. EGI FJ00035]MCT7374038.1 6-phosphogluconolactonase [Chelativorans sp. EGI FJ00035]